MKYITRKLLAEAIKIGQENEYNAQLDPHILQDIRVTATHTVEFLLIHHRRAGEPCEAHARILVHAKIKRKRNRHPSRIEPLNMDMSIEFFNALPGDPRCNITAAFVTADAIRSEAMRRTVIHVRSKMLGKSDDEVAAAVNRHLTDLSESLKKVA